MPIESVPPTRGAINLYRVKSPILIFGVRVNIIALLRIARQRGTVRIHCRQELKINNPGSSIGQTVDAFSDNAESAPIQSYDYPVTYRLAVAISRRPLHIVGNADAVLRVKD